MHLDLTDDETRALLNLITEAIEDDRYPLSPRVRVLRDILMKFGELGGLPPVLAAKLRRYAPPPAAADPPKVYASASAKYEPPTKGRYRRRR
jgi:hypothetical protein